jgi:hypothetical protein
MSTSPQNEIAWFLGSGEHGGLYTAWPGESLLTRARNGDQALRQALISVGGLVEGMLIRYNKRTVTIITDDGHQWNVSPGYLHKTARPEGAEVRASNVVRLKQEER